MNNEFPGPTPPEEENPLEPNPPEDNAFPSPVNSDPAPFPPAPTPVTPSSPPEPLPPFGSFGDVPPISEPPPTSQSAPTPQSPTPTYTPPTPEFPSPQSPPMPNFPPPPTGQGYFAGDPRKAFQGGFTIPAQLAGFFQANAGDPAQDQWALVSFALGAVNVFLACCLVWIPVLGCCACLVPLTAIGGLVAGYFGLQSTQKQMAQIALGLNAFALVAFFLSMCASLTLGVGTSFSGSVIVPFWL
jgi:hypothetical protein